MVFSIIEHLSSNGSRLFKESTLQQHRDNDLLKNVFFYTYNPYHNYYIRNVRSFGYSGQEGIQTNYERMFSLLDDLRARAYTGNSAVDECIAFIRNSCPAGAELFMRILERDLDCGVQIATINKIWSGFIPKFTCMLAHKDDPEFPCYAEEKYDGVRIITIVSKEGVSFYTRAGNSLDMPHIRQEIESLNLEDVVLDGEIIGSDRKSCSGLVNKFLKGTASEDDDNDFLYMVFDAMPLQDWYGQASEEFSERRAYLEELFEDAITNQVFVVDSREVHNEEEVNEFFDFVVAQGGEGLILKEPDHCYEWKRSKSWLKLKEENTIDLRVIELLDGSGKRAGGVGSLLCESSCKRLLVRVGSGLTDSDIAAFNAESPVGKIVEVMYNTLITSKHREEYSLFLPRFKGIREDKVEADSITGKHVQEAATLADIDMNSKGEEIVV